MADPGHARRFRQQIHQVTPGGNLDGSRGKPFRRLLAGALGECHGRQLYVGLGAVVPGGQCRGEPEVTAENAEGLW